jgi:N-acetylglucosamine-6-phosphate deacetylase
MKVQNEYLSALWKQIKILLICMKEPKPMKTIINNGSVVLPGGILEDGAVMIDEQGKIAFVGRAVDLPEQAGETLDLGGKILSPGLIDIHVHGGHGVTFDNPGSLAEDLRAYSSWVATTGVTGFLPSITAPSPEELTALIKIMVHEFNRGLPGAKGLGIHLEGPFLNVEKKGAQNSAWIRHPGLVEAQLYLQAGLGWIKQITIAPELPNAEMVAGLFKDAGVTVALGHSTADFDSAAQALSGLWTHVTHTFNAQTGFHHRRPGVVGAVMCSEGVTAELIADLVHVHPGAMKALVRCIGAEQIVLVTDAMEAAGLPDGEYSLLGATVYVVDGKATQADGTIASSSAVLSQCVKNMHTAVGISLVDAIKMASLNPARVLGMANQLGSIQVGMAANLIITDHNLNIFSTIVDGRIVYKSL